MLISVIAPFVIVAVAVAVVATPTVPSDCINVAIPTNGLLILTIALSYPLPAFVILISVIMPSGDTVAVADAPTLI